MKHRIFTLSLVLLSFCNNVIVYAQNFLNPAIFENVGTVSTLAVFASPPNPELRFMVLDDVGNVYAIIQEGFNWDTKLYKISQSGDKKLIASSLGESNGLAIDQQNNLYLAVGLEVKKITPQGAVSIIVSLEDKAKDKTSFLYRNNLWSLALDKSGNFISTTRNGEIIKISANGETSILGGNNISKMKYKELKELRKTKDERGLSFSNRMFVDKNGIVYALSSYGIMKVTPDGVITPFQTLEHKNGGYLDGDASKARIDDFNGFVVDDNSNIYFSEGFNNKIRKIKPNGYVTTVAGKVTENDGSASASAGRFGGGFKDGSADEALFRSPGFLAFDKSGNLLVMDRQNARIRRITLR